MKEFAIVIILVLITAIFLYFIFKKKPTTTNLSFEPKENIDVWGAYEAWMQAYIINYEKYQHVAVQSNYNNLKNKMTSYFLSKYNSEKVLYFMSLFDKLVQINIDNVHSANGEAVSLPGNGFEFAHAFASMARVSNQNHIVQIANIFEQHANNVASSAFAIQSGNESLAQTIFTKDLALIEQLANF